MIPMMNSVELVQAVALLDRIAPSGVVDRALRTAGIDRRVLAAGPGLLPYDIEGVLVDAVARSLGDPHLGARLARDFDYAGYGAYARYVLGAGDLRGTLLRGREAFPMLHLGSEIVIRDRGAHVLVGRASGRMASPGRRHLDEGAVLLIGDVVRHFLGEGWLPDWIEIPGNGYGRASDLEEIVGAPVMAGADMPAIAVRRCDLGARNPRPLPARGTVTLDQLPSLMGVTQPNTVAEAVRGILRAQIAEADFSEDSVARRLGLGSRTLQRRLKAEGTGFREVRMRFVEDRACALLAGSDLTVDQIARSLGYVEPNSFRRAFRGWTGQSPRSYRALAGGTGRHDPPAAATARRRQ